jgi:hypothetical protein
MSVLMRISGTASVELAPYNVEGFMFRKRTPHQSAD